MPGVDEGLWATFWKTPGSAFASVPAGIQPFRVAVRWAKTTMLLA